MVVLNRIYMNDVHFVDKSLNLNDKDEMNVIFNILL